MSGLCQRLLENRFRSFRGMREVKRIDTSRLDMRKSVEVQVDSDFALLLPSGTYEIKKMEPRRRLRSVVFICLALAIAGIIGFGYFCPDQVSALTLITSFCRIQSLDAREHPPHSRSPLVFSFVFQHFRFRLVALSPS